MNFTTSCELYVVNDLWSRDYKRMYFTKGSLVITTFLLSAWDNVPVFTAVIDKQFLSFSGSSVKVPYFPKSSGKSIISYIIPFSVPMDWNETKWNEIFQKQLKKLLAITMLSLFKWEFRRTFCSSVDHKGGHMCNVLASNALEVSKRMPDNHFSLFKNKAILEVALKYSIL